MVQYKMFDHGSLTKMIDNDFANATTLGSIWGQIDYIWQVEEAGELIYDGIVYEVNENDIIIKFYGVANGIKPYVLVLKDEDAKKAFLTKKEADRASESNEIAKVEA